MDINTCVIIFPNSLFKYNEIIEDLICDEIYFDIFIIEEPTYFSTFKLQHKLKLIMHRASMKHYLDHIKKIYKSSKYIKNIYYIEFSQNYLDEIKVYDNILFYDPVDHMVDNNLKKLPKRCEIDVYDTPLFILTEEELLEYDKKHKGKFHQTTFYKYQRHKFDILMKNGKYEGGKLSYDTDNREPLPPTYKNNYKPPKIINKYVEEAKKYINTYFSDNPGSTDYYWIPIDHVSAEKHFNKFLRERLKCFGKYQDAESSKFDFICHSVISPMMNIGLLEPYDIIEKTIKYGKKHKIEMNNIEGFIRQIISWRESMRLIYITKRKSMERSNFFNNNTDLDEELWFYLDDYVDNSKYKKYKSSKSEILSDGMGTKIPFVDNLILKVIKYGYLHHIERLMYIGNFMLLTGINPHDVFDWFLQMFVDSYNWVMYFNVYGMSQHSYPGLTTKPYFSSSAYIDKMSNYKKKSGLYDKIYIKKLDEEYEWYEVFNSLYYYFIYKNKKKLNSYNRIKNQVNNWNKKTREEKNKIIKISKSYINQYL